MFFKHDLTPTAPRAKNCLKDIVKQRYTKQIDSLRSSIYLG